MRSIEMRANVLEDVKVPVKLKRSALWAALMFLYASGDIFAYFRPGFIEDMMAGEVFAFEINQVFLLAISIYVAVPAVMVFLTLMLNPRLGPGRLVVRRASLAGRARERVRRYPVCRRSADGRRAPHRQLRLPRLA
jgi:Family of unknown function (DUF6326)